MASRALDAEIDRLYQLPLEEFTPARNVLAKGAGGEAARVRALSKPPVAAWAVNQLYWRKTQGWNALLAAAENPQRVQRAVLAARREEFEKVGTERDEQRAEEAVETAREALKRAAAELEQAEAAARAAARLREDAAKRARAAEKALPGARSRAESAAAALTAIEKGTK